MVLVVRASPEIRWYRAEHRAAQSMLGCAGFSEPLPRWCRDGRTARVLLPVDPQLGFAGRQRQNEGIAVKSHLVAVPQALVVAVGKPVLA